MTLGCHGCITAVCTRRESLLVLLFCVCEFLFHWSYSVFFLCSHPIVEFRYGASLCVGRQRQAAAGLELHSHISLGFIDEELFSSAVVSPFHPFPVLILLPLLLLFLVPRSLGIASSLFVPFNSSPALFCVPISCEPRLRWPEHAFAQHPIIARRCRLSIAVARRAVRNRSITADDYRKHAKCRPGLTSGGLAMQ